MLGLGEETGGRILRVLQADGDASRYRVSVQFETSWASAAKAHTSTCSTGNTAVSNGVRPTGGRDGFRLPIPTDGDQACFPHATREELRAAVQQALGKYDWAGRATAVAGEGGQASRVGEFPSYVAISMVRVRIEQHVGGKWTLLTTIDFSVPWGVDPHGLRLYQAVFSRAGFDQPSRGANRSPYFACSD
jgi:hypothetical protein